MTDIQARCRIHVTVEVDAGGGPWGSSETIARVHEQGARHAVDRLRKALQPIGGKVIGEPVVFAVIAERGGTLSEIGGGDDV